MNTRPIFHNVFGSFSTSAPPTSSNVSSTAVQYAMPRSPTESIVNLSAVNFPERIKCDFCDVTFKSDLDVSKHLHSEIHTQNKDRVLASKPRDKEVEKHIPKNWRKALESIGVKSVFDLRDLNEKNYFHIKSKVMASVAKQLSKVLLVAIVEFETRDFPDFIRNMLLESCLLEDPPAPPVHSKPKKAKQPAKKPATAKSVLPSPVAKQPLGAKPSQPQSAKRPQPSTSGTQRPVASPTKRFANEPPRPQPAPQVARSRPTPPPTTRPQPQTSRVPSSGAKRHSNITQQAEQIRQPRPSPARPQPKPSSSASKRISEVGPPSNKQTAPAHPKPVPLCVQRARKEASARETDRSVPSTSRESREVRASDSSKKRQKKRPQIEESSDSSESQPPPPNKPDLLLPRAMLNPAPEPRKDSNYVPKLAKIKVEPRQD